METNICSVVDCDGISKFKGFCRKHYRRWQKYGDPLGGGPFQFPETCTLVGCNRKHQARGYCDKHYTRLRKYGDPLFIKRIYKGESQRAVYALEHINSGKRYIGSTVDFHRRILTHKNTLQQGKGCNKTLQADWDAFGADAFRFIILEQVLDCVDLLAREQYWIDKTEDRYNVKPFAGTGKGTSQPWHWTKVQGVTEEQRQHMSEAQKRLYASGYKHPRARAVLQYSLDGVFIKEWENISLAAKDLGGHNALIVKCLKGVRRKTLNSTWKYKSDTI